MGSEAPLSSGVTDLKLEVVLEPELVLPAEPTDSTPVFLCNTDLCLVIPVETVYFYKPHPSKSTEGLAETLRTALTKVLVPYHPLAGRLRPTADGRLEIDCNRAGALFSHVKSGVSIADLGDVTQPNGLFRGLVPHKFKESHIFAVPLLAIQVTTFKCGGFTMGFMMSHTTMDGAGAIDFFSNYTSIARGEGLLYEPSFDRTSLKARVPPIIKYEHPENFELPSDVDGLSADQSPFTTAANAEKEFVALENSVKHVTKVFPYTAEDVERLKKRAQEGGEITKVSTFEVVAADIWLARTKAVDLPPDVPFNLLFAVDTRKRLRPVLHEHFAGNAVYSACARGTPKQIEQYTFVEAVKVIRAAVDQVTDDYIRSSLDWGSVKKGVPALFGGFFLSAWWKMPFYNIDYGWGKPVYAGPIVSPLVEFVYLLSNGTRDGGLNLCIALEPRHMAKFEALINH